MGKNKRPTRVLHKKTEQTIDRKKATKEQKTQVANTAQTVNISNAAVNLHGTRIPIKAFGACRMRCQPTAIRTKTHVTSYRPSLKLRTAHREQISADQNNRNPSNWGLQPPVDWGVLNQTACLITCSLPRYNVKCESYCTVKTTWKTVSCSNS